MTHNVDIYDLDKPMSSSMALICQAQKSGRIWVSNQPQADPDMAKVHYSAKQSCHLQPLGHLSPQEETIFYIQNIVFAYPEHVSNSSCIFISSLE